MSISSLVNSEIDELFRVIQSGGLDEGRERLERVLEGVSDLDRVTQAAAYDRLESVAEMYGIRLPRVEPERVEKKEKERDEKSAFRPGMECGISLQEIEREDFIQIDGTPFDANQFIRGVLCTETPSNPFTRENLSNDQIRALLDHFGLNDVSAQSFKDIWEDARADFEEELTSETLIHQNDEAYQLGRLIGQDIDGANADRRRDFRIRRFLGLFAGKDSERAMVKLIRLSDSVPPQMMGRLAYQPQRRRERVQPVLQPLIAVGDQVVRGAQALDQQQLVVIDLNRTFAQQMMDDVRELATPRNIMCIAMAVVAALVVWYNQATE